MKVVVSYSHVVSLLLTLFPCFSVESSTSFFQESPSHGLQFFINCCSMGPSHGLQCFRNTLLQGDTPTRGSQIPKKACSSMVFPTGFQPPLGIHFLWYMLFHMDLLTSVGCRATATSPWSSYSCQEILALVPRAPPFFTDLGTCKVVPLLYSHFFPLWLQLLLCRNFLFCLCSRPIVNPCF